jgi:hypothetical protein
MQGITLAVPSLASPVQVLLATLLGERLAVRLQVQLMTSLVSEEASFFQTRGKGELLSRLTSDTQEVSAALIDFVSYRGLRSILEVRHIFHTSDKRRPPARMGGLWRKTPRWAACREHLGNIRGTFGEHSGTIREHLEEDDPAGWVVDGEDATLGGRGDLPPPPANETKEKLKSSHGGRPSIRGEMLLTIMM